MNSLERGGSGFGPYLRNALPSILSMVFLSFYTTVDGLFVSHMAGSDALAAINIVIPVTCLLFGLAVMLACGAGAIIGERLGEGRKKEADNLFSFITFCLLAFTAVFTLACLVMIRPLARLLGSTARLDVHVLPYLAAILAGAVPMAFKLYFEYLARTDGHPKVALLMSSGGLVLNLILDFLFVVVLDMGTLGAGLGTTLSIAASALVGLVHFLRGRNLRFIRFHAEPRSLLKSCTNGSSEMLSELSTGITTLLFNLIILSVYGEDGVAAVTVVMYVYYFFIAFYMGLAVSAAPLVSFSYGAGDWPRIGRILRYSFITLAFLALVMTLAAYLTSPLVASVFLEPSAAWEITVHGLELTSLVYLTCGLNVFMSSYFTALGDGLRSAVISTLRSLILVSLFLLVLPPVIGDAGIWLSLPLADLATLPFSLIFFLRKGRVSAVRKHRLLELEAAALSQDILS